MAHPRYKILWALLLALALGACSSTVSSLEPVYVPPSPPSEKAVSSAVAKVATDARLAKPVEISAVRTNDHGPGGYFVCAREVDPPPGKTRRYYSIFLDNEDYKGSRLSVIMDQCELQTYSPAPDAAPAAAPPPSAQPSKRKSHSS